MNLKRSGLRRLMICLAGLVLLVAAPSCICSNSNGHSNPSPSLSPGAHATCHPLCHKPRLSQNGEAATGQVRSAQQISSALGGGGPLSRRDSSYVVVLNLPKDSSPGTNDTLTFIVNNPQPVPTVGEFLTVVVIPYDPSKQLFIALSMLGIQRATLQAFQNQLIEYQGIETAAVSCLEGNCAGQPLTFDLNGLTFNFTLNSQTNVQGFGSPPSINAKQAIDVIVQFVQGNPPMVLQVANPALFSTPTPSPTI